MCVWKVWFWFFTIYYVVTMIVTLFAIARMAYFMRRDIRDSQKNDEKNHRDRILHHRGWIQDDDTEALNDWYNNLWKIKRPLGSYEEAIQMEHVTLTILFSYLFGQLYQVYLLWTTNFACSKLKKDWGKVPEKKQYEIVNVEAVD